MWFDRLTRNAGWGLVVGCPEEAGLKPARTHEGAGAGSEGLGALGAVGCQGWLGCGRVVGWHWVPAGDAGMAGEEDGRVGDGGPRWDWDGEVGSVQSGWLPGVAWECWG